MDPKNIIMSLTSAAAALGESYRTLQYLIHEGKIVPVYSGIKKRRATGVSVAEVERYLAEHPKGRAPASTPQA